MLFVCARNRRRSVTAEAIFSGLPGVEVSSCGTAPDAECVASTDLMEWADEIYVMEKRQKAILSKRFARELQGKAIVCLEIPDRYCAMQPELMELLRARALPRLRQGGGMEEER